MSNVNFTDNEEFAHDKNKLEVYEEVSKYLVSFEQMNIRLYFWQVVFSIRLSFASVAQVREL